MAMPFLCIVSALCSMVIKSKTFIYYIVNKYFYINKIIFWINFEEKYNSKLYLVQFLTIVQYIVFAYKIKKILTMTFVTYNIKL